MTCLAESPICNAFTYGFENGVTGGWTLASACAGGGSPTVSSVESHSGTRTLAIGCSGSGLMRLQHNLCTASTNKASIAGKTVSAWVYWDGPAFPTGDTTSGCELTVWISQASSGGQSSRVYKPVGGWHQMQKKIIDTLNPLQSVSIDCYVNSNWSGVMYVDDITVN
jgi:hypothetical protein